MVTRRMSGQQMPSPPSPAGSRDSSPGSEPAAHRSKAGIRVSLACVPCRSKHIKCDATTPTCLRCQLDQKPCYYAKSRRGIRDAKRRSMMCDKTPAADPTGGMWPLTHMTAYQLPIRFLNDMPAGWSVSRAISPGSAPGTATALLLDHFYATCFGCFSWVLPKADLMARVSASPADLQFLIGTITYVASLYDATISSDELRERVCAQACGPLPMTPFTIQALLMLSICALGDDKAELCTGLLDRAIRTALDIGMQHRAFADAEPDAVLAENYRRTYWALYIQDCHRAVRDMLPTFSLYGVPATTEMPCEEWEYQSGTIPKPVSFAVYDNRDPVEEPTFSSWVYCVDIFRLIGEIVLPLKLYQDKPWYDELHRADIRITNFLVRIPKWKKDAVDGSGQPDMVLWLALGMAYSARIRIRQPYNRLQQPLKDGFSIGPLERPQLPSNVKLQGNWSVFPPELEPVNSFCNTYTGYLSPSFYSPVSMCGVARMCLAVLDGCVFLGCDSPAVREKLSLGLAILKRGGEVWPLARRLAAGIKGAAAVYLPPLPQQGTAAAAAAGRGQPGATNGGGGGGGPDLFADLGWNAEDNNFFAGMSMPAEIHPALATASLLPSFSSAVGNDGFEEWLVGDGASF